MICNHCKIDQPIDEFVFKNKIKNERHSYCRSCQKVRKRQHYLNNKQYYADKNIVSRSNFKKWVAELKRGLRCSRCSENHIGCLDHHHTKDDKEENVGKLIADHASKERILREISKCIVLCSNCHRKLHWEEKTNGRSSNRSRTPDFQSG